MIHNDCGDLVPYCSALCTWYVDQHNYIEQTFHTWSIWFTGLQGLINTLAQRQFIGCSCNYTDSLQYDKWSTFFFIFLCRWWKEKRCRNDAISYILGEDNPNHAWSYKKCRSCVLAINL